ncbi:MAG TPA: prolyl oligopeptidase family serine peptidase, partial [Chitinophagaceae bacterium]|nr:prolyl oligopeptidase family serine peptidase [Chitinophagaceae bacterium]
TNNGKYNLHWAAHDRIVFLSAKDNWPHLYSIPVSGGEPTLLTPGKFMVEYISLSSNGKQLVFSANTGPDELDIDRRHIGVVSVDKQDMEILTPGDGIEAYPVYINNSDIAFISSTAFRPALPTVWSHGQDQIKLIGTSLLSSVYSEENLVEPEQVIFKAPDGTPIHGQLFRQKGTDTTKPAVLAIHGGPMRQMLLGWSYSAYYAPHYALNQWLAHHGFVVLSVNYRMGIGYGNEFHHPTHAGRHGFSEYQDIIASGKWLAKQPYVDERKIGVYGGSYGGYLTAFALGKNSDIFAAGVDISGVHSRVPSEKYTIPYEQAPDAALADTVAWESSPIAYTDTWESPVLFIHADDDRNVAFNHSIKLLNRLKEKDVYYETLVIPDDTHHWLRHANLVKVYKSTIDFLVRKLSQ